jgi:putative hydrolase of the HAD superfamily
LRRRPLARLGQRRGPVWLLDLDNTLHDAGSRIMPVINSAMTAWLAHHLELGAQEASALRVAYWKRYGATLLGMIAHHAINPHDFLRETHPLGEIRRHVSAQHALGGVLRRLPGVKVVLTNAPQHYAQAVLRWASLHHRVTQVVAIEQMRFAGAFRPKPSLAMFAKVCARLGVLPQRCVLVEDSPQNLHAARRLRMRTVLVLEHSSAGGSRCCFAGPGRRIDRQVHSPRQLERLIGPRA